MIEALALQPRLQLISTLVPQNAKLADVGTDHGYLPIYLLQVGRISSAIATDIGVEPLAHARRTAKECEITDISFRCCDGLRDVAPHEVDTVVIAGMGGETICHILQEAKWTKDAARLLLLQPMTKTELLREWLCANGYRIMREQFVRDKGILYTVLSVCGGEAENLTLAEVYGGVHAQDDPLYRTYLQERIGKIRYALSGLSRATRPDTAKRKAELQNILAALEERDYAESKRN